MRLVDTPVGDSSSRRDMLIGDMGLGALPSLSRAVLVAKAKPGARSSFDDQKQGTQR
jgi:hypothetical protein